ncbi:very-long-chain (3R)-3-hydroxyacyl-CoA dehydratase 3 isoform X1 [Tenrec ecaudatus]|uniref:very-long-chain (3R)-3-hydroxyacyl-CoA dehydratase 3 isoform X1 n=1 Tax=Tenrec ecaudatus TaxID=94439 RepID=UPI003F59A1DA
MENQVLTPHVYWAQRHRELYLRVELSDVQNPVISITENVLHFKAQGHGAKGDNVYEFHLEFLDPVKPEPVHRLTQRQVNITVQKKARGGRQDNLTGSPFSQPVHRLTQRQVNITVQKKASQWWERLTKQEKRPLFLAPDFDRWLDESDAEMELRAKEEERLNKLRMESEGSPETLASMKKGYLFMYNLVQFLGFSWIFVNLTVRFFILGKESFYDTFHSVADMMYFCQMLAVVETVNAAIGVTRTPLLPSLVQLLGRNFILFIIFGTMEEMQSRAVVFFVFYVWSTMEIFRYPFYMLSCIDMDWKVLTWLRYSLWIPLYPLGCLAEAVSVIQSIPVFNEAGRFSFTLPYPVKLKVRFSFFLQIYLILIFLGLYINFRHLYKQRRRLYGHKKRKSH